MQTGKKVGTNFAWRFAERVGAQGVNLVVELVLARKLDPDHYGLIALVTVFITILSVFISSGMGTALIQKKDSDVLDFSTVFWFNIVMSFVLYGVLFVSAPLVAHFYNKPIITDVLRVLGLQLIVSGVKNTQLAYVSRHLIFRRFFFATLGGTLGAAVIGIWMAMHGYGVWALVAQHLFNTLIDTIILWITVKWRPKLQFSFARLKILFSFGWKMLLSSLIDKIYNEIRQLLIGKIYSDADLGFYNRGRSLPHLFVSNVNASIDSVLLPTMSKEQDRAVRVRAMTRRAIKTSSYIMAPLLMGLAFTAEPFVSLVLTDKWLPCVPFLRVFCISFMFQPIHTANLNAIKAMGRSDLFLILEIIKKVIGITALVITVNISVMAMAYSLLFTSVTSQIINSWPNRKLLGYTYLNQLKDILPAILLALFMGVCVYLVEFIGLINWLTLLIQVPLGAAIYVGGSKILRLDSFDYLLKLIRGSLRHRRNKGNKTKEETSK